MCDTWAKELMNLCGSGRYLVESSHELRPDISFMYQDTYFPVEALIQRFVPAHRPRRSANPYVDTAPVLKHATTGHGRISQWLQNEHIVNAYSWCRHDTSSRVAQLRHEQGLLSCQLFEEDTLLGFILPSTTLRN